MSPSLATILSKTNPNEPDHPSSYLNRPSSLRWTGSFSSPSLSPSSSFSSSSSAIDSPSKPYSPRPTFGIPFSWEHLPGIPIQLASLAPLRYKELLPLPPAAHHRTPKKKSQHSIRSDPFVSALVKCSKESHANLSRSLFARSGLMDHVSCKTRCSVVESTVFIPRARPVTHGLVSHRTG